MAFQELRAEMVMGIHHPVVAGPRNLAGALAVSTALEQMMLPETTDHSILVLQLMHQWRL